MWGFQQTAYLLTSGFSFFSHIEWSFLFFPSKNAEARVPQAFQGGTGYPITA